MTSRFSLIDYNKPLGELSKEEADYHEMECREAARMIAQRYRSKGPNFLVGIAMYLKEEAYAMQPKQKAQE